MRYAATASLLAALAVLVFVKGCYIDIELSPCRAAETVNPVSTTTSRTVYLAPDGTVLTSATGANRKLAAQGNAVVGTPTWLVPTATPTPIADSVTNGTTLLWPGGTWTQGDDVGRRITGLVPTPTATPKMDCPAGFVCMTNNTDVDMRVTLDVGPTPTATATPKEK